MTTPSSDAPGARVLFRSDRVFKVWRYGVGHSQLLLRSVPDDTENRCLDILFEGVSAMQLVTRYASVELMSANAEEADRILEFSGLDPRWEDRFLVVSLRSESGSGTVLCRR